MEKRWLVGGTPNFCGRDPRFETHFYGKKLYKNIFFCCFISAPYLGFPGRGPGIGGQRMTNGHIPRRNSRQIITVNKNN